MYNPIKHELQLIISGAGKVSFGTTIQTASRYLGKGTPSSPKAENPKQIRKQEAEKLKKFISDNNL
jgi:hypothetical protein